MRSILTIFLLTALVGFNGELPAQPIERFNSFSYNVNEGLLQSNVLDMAFDKNNFCWLSFANGIQKFDGKNFLNIPLQHGLPDDKWVKFFRCSNGELLIMHSEGISKYESNNNRFIQIYFNVETKNNPLYFIGEDENIIYFFSKNGIITGIHNRSYKLVSEVNSGLSNEHIVKFSDNIFEHKVGIQINSILYLWDLQKRKLIHQSSSMGTLLPFFLFLKNANEVFYYNELNTSLRTYNFINKTNSLVTLMQPPSAYASRTNIYRWNKKNLLSYYNFLYETDASFQVIKSQLVNFQNSSIAGNSTISHIKEDNFGNLYLITINDGFRKIISNNYPIKYFGTDNKKDNYIISVLPEKKSNRILAGTYGQGLLLFDTLQKLVKHIKTLPDGKEGFSVNTIIKNTNGNYILFLSGEKKVLVMDKDLIHMKLINIISKVPENNSGINYFTKLLFQNDKGAFIHSQNHLYKANFFSNTITEHKIPDINAMSGFLYKDVILTHTNDSLFVLDTVNFKTLKKIPVKNTGGVRCFATDAIGNIYLGCNKGIFKLDKHFKVLQHLNRDNGLPDECIYAMAFDDEGYLWCSTNKGILKISKDNNILQLKKEDGLQENEFNTNVVAKTEDGEIFFGGVNGASSFYPQSISTIDDEVNVLFTGIKINNKEAFTDTAAWNIDDIHLPYHQNLLSFDFVAMGSSNAGQYVYQYRMDGIDKEWIQDTEMQTVRYFLPPGNYIFQVYASRFFDKDAKPLKQIKITIDYPFWKTWWFLSAMALLVILGSGYSINQYNRRKYVKKLMVLESEKKLQSERERISRDLHDNIGAYANAVLYKTDLLQKEKTIPVRNELMQDLKFASKDIINSLRETIWALKKEEYTAEECLLRIRNFVQALSRYYQHIHFTVTGEAPTDKVLHYSKALNLIRIIQEALTNALKHSGASNIIIQSKIINNKWELIVLDDGKGFDFITVNEQQKGNGLTNMQQRATDASFDVSIQPLPDKGTQIIVVV
ncbi:MAG: histidine kinase [Bacteroidota bacterium]|nr:histidine kinase [Bacteroidota bacterium]